jgi:AraC-like DNA-binding protein
MLEAVLGPSLDARPDGHAATLVEGAWWREVTGAGIVVPDGSVDLMWSPGRDPWVAGPDTGPRPVELPTGSRVVGVRLRPGIAAALLGSGVDEATDRNVPIADVAPRREAEQLDEQLTRSATPAATARALAGFVSARVGADWSPDPLVAGAISAIRAGRSLDLGVGDRQLRRRFTRAVGYGTAFFRRVIRLDRFSMLLEQRPGSSIAQLAAECGYFDEAHLWRDCIALTARTPGEMRAQIHDRSVQAGGHLRRRD